MKAPDFDYYRPQSLSDALALLAAHPGEAQPLAGGQSLLAMMNFRIASPEVLVDLAHVPELRGIERGSDTIRIGAMTTWAELMALGDLARDLPLLAAALPHIAHDAIRNRGTIGGSLALADAAAELPALAMALDGTVELAGAGGRREVAADDFFLGYFETARAEDELVTALRLPLARPGSRFGFYELARRHGDYAMAGAAVAARGIAPFKDLRIALFGVAACAVRAKGIERALEGTSPSAAEIEEALPMLEDVPFEGDAQIPETLRRHYAGIALKRALQEMTR